ncbi:MAG: cbb3-type cytochrome oxidase subunit 3 [Arenicella sp.]
MMGVINGLFTLVLLVIFIGIWVWAWSKRNADTFAAMAHLPLLDQDSTEVSDMATISFINKQHNDIEVTDND